MTVCKRRSQDPPSSTRLIVTSLSNHYCLKCLGRGVLGVTCLRQNSPGEAGFNHGKTGPSQGPASPFLLPSECVLSTGSDPRRQQSKE